MDIGTAAAIKEAGMTGKVFLATSGGGEQKGACDLVKAGAIDYDLSYDVPTQASNMAAMIKWLVQGGVKPGAAKQNIYTTLIPITKDNAGKDGTCWKLSAAK
jgi:simple sugar transport system substrate-binding protein/ribose transport system substrate-binding protein